MPRTKKTAEKATEKKVEAVETKTRKTKSSAPEKVEIKETKKEKITVDRKRSVLFVASEANPFIATGGLADVCGSLPISLAARNNYDVRVILPLYGQMEEGYKNHLTYLGSYNVPVGWRNQYCGLFSYKRKNVTFYFVDNEYYFKRDGLYGHFDDGERFAFFSRAALETMKYLDFYPDVLHAHDWQAALSVVYLKTIFKDKPEYDRIRTVFTIHNIEYQGQYDKSILGDLFGLPQSVESILDYDGCLNLMKGAIQVSDFVTTVSRTYAEEIKDPYFAHGLQYIIKDNEEKICGILNGIDVDGYNPETDARLFANFSAEDPKNKAICKRELQKMLDLPVKDDVPVIAIISRLASHKGIDLVKCVLEELLSEDVQVVVLGKGEPYYEGYFNYVAEAYKGKCRAIIAYNRDLSSKIYSGADIFLMPSKQEPCGLSQMIACRYGTIPVVRRTGGLADSIVSYTDDKVKGNGFVFNNYNAHEMLYAIKDAVFTYGDKDVWNNIMRSAMTTDFSWNKSAAEYEELYDKLKV